MNQFFKTFLIGGLAISLPLATFANEGESEYNVAYEECDVASKSHLETGDWKETMKNCMSQKGHSYEQEVDEAAEFTAEGADTYEPEAY